MPNLTNSGSGWMNFGIVGWGPLLIQLQKGCGKEVSCQAPSQQLPVGGRLALALTGLDLRRLEQVVRVAERVRQGRRMGC